MKYLTFSQALLAASLIGLTLMLTLGWELVLWISIGHSAGAGPSIIGPTAMLAIAFALALAVIVVAARRLRANADSRPLTFGDLLVVAGVLGLLITTLLASQSLAMMASAEWDQSESLPAYRQTAFYLQQALPPYLEVTWNPSGLPAYGGSAALQALALVIPLVVTGFGMRRRLREGPAAVARVHAAQAQDVATALALFGLMIAFATSPAVLYDLALERANLDYHWVGYYFFDLGLFAAGLAGPGLALAVLLAGRGGSSGPVPTPVLLAVAALVGLTTCVATSHSLPLLALAIATILAGLMWINHAAFVLKGERRGIPTGQLLVVVAALGLVVSFVAAPHTSAAINWARQLVEAGLVTSAYEPMIVMPVIAFVIHIALLALAFRVLRAGAESTAAEENA